jgi:hypothetical protein
MDVQHLFMWQGIGGCEYTGYALTDLERPIAGHPCETAGGEVCQDRFTQEVEASVWVNPSMQAGMAPTKAWKRSQRVPTLAEGQRWCEATLGAKLTASPTPWRRIVDTMKYNATAR